MKKDIILAGVGGQGILSIAATIGTAALIDNLNMKQSEVHGMAQRGGAVQSHLRLSSEEILSDLVPKGKADMILSMEPMEALRYLPYLQPNGWIVTNSKAYENITDYPDMNVIHDEIKKTKNHLIIDAEGIAAELNASKSANMVLIGAAAQKLELNFDKIEQAIKQIFGSKGPDVIETNLKALHKGRDIAAAN
jgi:indolepyruvate ferredoxin oxidoreductase beta subunit